MNYDTLTTLTSVHTNESNFDTIYICTTLLLIALLIILRKSNFKKYLLWALGLNIAIASIYIILYGKTREEAICSELSLEKCTYINSLPADSNGVIFDVRNTSSLRPDLITNTNGNCKEIIKHNNIIKYINIFDCYDFDKCKCEDKNISIKIQVLDEKRIKINSSSKPN